MNSASGSCDRGGNSVSSILLKDKQTGRVLAIGNAHPEISSEISNNWPPPRYGYCGWLSEGQSSIDCRASSIETMFKFQNIDFEGMSGNAIVSGDFNMDYPDLSEIILRPNKLTCNDTNSFWINSRKRGFKEIGRATVTLFGGLSIPTVWLDHLLTNIPYITSSCFYHSLDPLKFREEPSFGHDFILCDIFME